MRFYDREQEIAFLRDTRDTAEKVARFTVVTGRRRIGKTTLIREAYKDVPFVYFFVARKAESDLCWCAEAACWGYAAGNARV